MSGDSDEYDPSANTYNYHAAAEDDDDDEDYDPSTLITDLPYTAPSPVLPAPIAVQADAQPDTASINESAPASISSSATSQAPSRVASRMSGANAITTQPRTLGGFIVDDDDDEDEAHNNTTSQAADANGLLAVAETKSSSRAQTPMRAVSQTPAMADVTVHRPSQEQASAASSVDPSAAPVSASPSAPVSSSISISNNTTTAPSGEGKAAEASEKVPAPFQSNAPASISLPAPSPTSAPKARLPHDKVGQLEDRIAEDPKGDVDAWLSLINLHRSRNKLDDARSVYDRFFKILPTAADQWVSYANMELEAEDLFRLEQIFNRSLLQIPNVQLWTIYLDHVRRRNNLLTDVTGDARKIVQQSYDFVLQSVGNDKEAGPIWQDYLQFLKSGPGVVGGSNWQDSQKMDLLRKTYQRAICVPTEKLTGIWKEYEQFEMGLNKVTGRKYVQEKSPHYITARTTYTRLQTITKHLKRYVVPILPPVPGCEGDDEYAAQVKTWKDWIAYEKEDPLVLKDEDKTAYLNRVHYTYRQAVMTLRFWPEVWFDAAEFCFQNDMVTEGNEFLTQGTAANPESCLLAFKQADRIELTTTSEEGDDSLKRRGEQVREPYEKLLDALYALIAKVKERETKTIAFITESMTNAPTPPRASSEQMRDISDDEDDAGESTAPTTRELVLKSRVEAVQKVHANELKALTRAISFAWIALMRAMRRIQGKGRPGDSIGGSRQIFTDARKRGRLTSEVYVASALIEYHCYKDPAATKIFERGMKLFPEDEIFALEYLRHLISTNDITNARAVFETTVSRLTSKPTTIHLAKPIFSYFYEYESHYGELSQITKLETRMATLFSSDPSLSRFAQRYRTETFDPTTFRPVISAAAQAKPKAMPSIEVPKPVEGVYSPRPATAPGPSQPAHQQNTNAYVPSPKRPLHIPEDSDSEQPRKFARGESPLKGAAGRRTLAAAKRNQHQAQDSMTAMPALPRDVMILLSLIPGAASWNATRFSPEGMVGLLRDIDLGRVRLEGQGGVQTGGAYGGYSYGR
ncbi:mRNA 3'-end-processing protein rna14 [Elasticomyces elasticus]|nr:mRNA 3'-end-processing protein rna14 [Elasticomyces elasticus]